MTNNMEGLTNNQFLQLAKEQTDELIYVLRDEVHAYASMLIILEEQQQSIITHNTDMLLAINGEISRQVSKNTKVKNKRESYIKLLADTLGLDETLRLRDLMPYIQDRFKALVEALILEVLSLVSKIHKKVGQNQVLLFRLEETASEILESLIPEKAAKTYNSRGTVSSGSMFDGAKIQAMV